MKSTFVVSKYDRIFDEIAKQIYQITERVSRAKRPPCFHSMWAKLVINQEYKVKVNNSTLAISTKKNGRIHGVDGSWSWLTAGWRRQWHIEDG
jgi:hypothetical protein